MNLGAPELIIILAVVLLLFGSTRLPKLARSLGQASKEFRQGAQEADQQADGIAGQGTTGDGRRAPKTGS